MRVNIELSMEMTSCKDCKCRVSDGDECDKCFLDFEDDKISIDYRKIPDNCLARKFEVFDEDKIINELIEEYKQKFNRNIIKDYINGELFLHLDKSVFEDSDCEELQWIIRKQEELSEKYKISFNFV